MNSTIARLLDDVVQARARVVDALDYTSVVQAAFKPTPDAWCMIDIVEHLTMAERSGTFGLWKALDGMLRGAPVFTGEHTNRGRPIEDVIAEWGERVNVPAIAAPAWGGSLDYWVAAYHGGHTLLTSLGEALSRAVERGIALEDVISPHPISGPLDAVQRLAFLRAHAERHTKQIMRVRADAGFPA